MPKPILRVGLSKANYTGGAPVTIRVPRRSNGIRSNSALRRPLADNRAAINTPDLQGDEDILAPPKASDDEDGTAPAQYVGCSSDDEPLRGDIPKSNFANRTAATKKGTTLSKRRLSTREQEPIREQLVHTTSCEAQAGSSPPERLKTARRNAQQGKPKVEPFKSSVQPDIFGVLPSSQQGKKRKRCYGAKSSQQSAPTSSFSPKSALKYLPHRVSSSPSTPQKTLKIAKLEDVDSPTDETIFQPSRNPDLDESPLSTKKQFAKPKALESPIREENSPSFRHPVLFDDSFDSDEELGSNLDITSRLATQSQIRFRYPSLTEDLLLNAPSQVERGLIESDDSIPEIETSFPENALQSVCPMCSEIVDTDFLENFYEGRMNIRIQAKFCRAHKKRSARETWTSRGYPEISWHELDGRIQTHHPHLDNLLSGAPSHYRELLKELMKSGKNRTLKQAMMSSGDSLTPGYYGSRGQRVMSENIMKRFSPTLRNIAIKDRLVSAQGVAGYVQAVLVPELAVLLIKEDMGTDIENARAIMKESIALGDLVNEETEDVVTRRTGTDEEITIIT